MADAEEMSVLRRAYARELIAWQSQPSAAKRLVSVGESPRLVEIDPVELATWTSLAGLLLNLSEVITKQ